MKGEYMIVSDLNRCIFTGEAVSIGGLAECAGALMWPELDFLLALPDDTKIFCGRERTKANFEFCLEADPEDAVVKEFWQKYEAILNSGAYPVPSVLRDEKRYNIFVQNNHLRKYKATRQTQSAADLFGYETTVPEWQRALHVLKNWKNPAAAAADRGGCRQSSCILRQLADQSPANKLIVIEVVSAGFHAGSTAKITINDVQVKVERNLGGHYRGLHVVLINPQNGKVEFAQVFDTSESSHPFNAFLAHHEIPEGYIVVAACQDDCRKKMSHKCKRWFKAMGATAVTKLKYRQSYAFIGIWERHHFREDPAVLDKPIRLIQVFRVNSNFAAQEITKTNAAHNYLLDLISPIKDGLKAGIEKTDILRILADNNTPEAQPQAIYDQIQKRVEHALLEAV